MEGYWVAHTILQDQVLIMQMIVSSLPNIGSSGGGTCRHVLHDSGSKERSLAH
jgi:hypothetical protein